MRRHTLIPAALVLVTASSLLQGQSLRRDRTPVPRFEVSIGAHEARSPLITTPAAPDAAAARLLGDTFDSELVVLDPGQTVAEFLSAAALGQSLLADGSYQPAGISMLSGQGIEASVDQIDNGDGSYTIIISTRTPMFSDGFVPNGFTFSPSGLPVDTLEWRFGAPADRDAAPDPYDPMLMDDFPPLGEFDVLQVDYFLLDNGVELGSGTSGAIQFDQAEINFDFFVEDAAGSLIDRIQFQYIVQSADATPAIVLEAQDDCLGIGENQLVVDIDMRGMTELVVGGQFFLEYDESLLDFVSVVPGDGPFTREVYESVNEGAGTIDYAVGVEDGGVGTFLPTTMARVTFNVLGDFCATPDLVAFRPSTPPSRLSDATGTDLGAATINLGPVTRDTLPPVLIVPPDIQTNADAGGCSATLDFVEPFDTDPALCPSQTPDCWYVDRYAPAAFESALFDGGARLRHGISSADSAANRPPAFAGAFYDTQGRKHDVDIPVGESWSIDLHIDAGWATQVRRADIWATTFDSANAISGFPILGFTSNDPADPANPSPASQTPRFRLYTQDTDQNPVNGLSAGWVDLGLPGGFSYDRWWTLEVELTPTAYEFRVKDDGGATVLAFTDNAVLGSLRAGNLIVQAYNFSESYDVYWDNVTLGPVGPVATDDCSDVTLTYERSDNPSLTLHDPFPSGATTITWTASDACGNTTVDEQDVVVDPVNGLKLAVELADVDVPSAFDRCVTLELIPAGGGPPVVVPVTLSFVDGMATDTIEVPCGDYDCITARDALHTLRRTDLDDFTISGAIYIADFTSSGGPDDDSLVGGNLNDDQFIDIVDFGVFIVQYGTTVGADTPCATPGPHSDISGDAEVDGADYTFIAINYLQEHEPRCDGSVLPADGPGPSLARPGQPAGPTTSVSVARLHRVGLGHLAEADLNLDGVLDEGDIVAFIQGARPPHLFDLNADRLVDARDVGLVAEAINSNDPAGDVNRDGSVNHADLVSVLEHVGRSY